VRAGGGAPGQVLFLFEASTFFDAAASWLFYSSKVILCVCVYVCVCVFEASTFFDAAASWLFCSSKVILCVCVCVCVCMYVCVCV
jgi:hypothetical protein